MKTRVIGLGNPILTDDGVGIYAARAIRRVLPPTADVDVVELAVGGLELMEAMMDYDRVILLDAFWNNGQSGQVMSMTASDLALTMNSASAHDVDLPTALYAGRQIGAALPADGCIHIVAVSAQQVLEFGERPTPAVAAAIPEAVTRVLRLLGYATPPHLLAVVQSVLGGYDDIS